MIRKARKTDADAIKLIATLAWQQAYSDLIPAEVSNEFLETNYNTETILEKIKNDGVVVATIDKLIVGFAHFRNHEDHTHLQTIYVLPTHQKQGLGTDLLKRVEKESKKTGALLVLELENGNKIGDTFYKRRGFEEFEYRADQLHGHPVKTKVMKKTV
ncbi:GNAT family N-acetyltransferase [Erysipelothrix sp. HDW6C]|uniref:GNAT family N-acetyltransferase n=1 Tax=Erysipelothrix sp. HDW6C TaxID=2714930 RepID=UPI00140B56B1|nr:GNAT family N-acetyltransferase [Erysipelothrix sp. HDW6C]QIK69526.1 GNAT family N-acetyltransferase [Erysipelothrix sp. HDW6C]